MCHRHIILISIVQQVLKQLRKTKSGLAIPKKMDQINIICFRDSYSINILMRDRSALLISFESLMVVSMSVILFYIINQL